MPTSKNYTFGCGEYYRKRHKYYTPPPADTDKLRVFIADERYFFNLKNKLGGSNYVANQITEKDLKTFFDEIQEMESQKRLPNLWDSINVKRAICCVISIFFMIALVVIGATTKLFYLIPIGLVGGAFSGIGVAAYYQVRFNKAFLARNDDIKTKISAWNITIGDPKNLRMDYEQNLRWITIQYIGPENHRALFAPTSNIVCDIITGVPYVKSMFAMQQNSSEYPAQGGNQVVITDIENMSVKISEFVSPTEPQGNAIQNIGVPYVKPMFTIQENSSEHSAQGGNQVVIKDIENISVKISEFVSPAEPQANTLQDPENFVKAPM